MKIEKKQSKKLKSFQKLLDELEPSSTITTGRARAVQVEDSKETDQKLYLKALLTYLDNPSEKALSEISEIKEQHETIKLLNEEVTLRSSCLGVFYKIGVLKNFAKLKRKHMRHSLFFHKVVA